MVGDKGRTWRLEPATRAWGGWTSTSHLTPHLCPQRHSLPLSLPPRLNSTSTQLVHACPCTPLPYAQHAMFPIHQKPKVGYCWCCYYSKHHNLQVGHG